MSSNPVAEHLANGSWGLLPIALGILGWVAFNFGPFSTLLCLMVVVSLFGLLLSLTVLMKGGARLHRVSKICLCVFGFVTISLVFFVIAALSREREGGEIVLHVRAGSPLPERVAVTRDFPDFLSFLQKPIELEQGKGQDGCYTFSARVQMGKWRLVARPDYQDQVIMIATEEPKFEDHITFAKVLDGRPDEPTEVKETSKPEEKPTDRAAPTTEDTEEKEQPTASVGLPDTVGGSPPRDSKPRDQVEHMKESQSSTHEETVVFQSAPESIQVEELYAKVLRDSKSCEKRGDLTGAVQELSDFIDRFPHEPYAEEAKRRRSELLKKGGGDDGQ